MSSIYIQEPPTNGKVMANFLFLQNIISFIGGVSSHYIRNNVGISSDSNDSLLVFRPFIKRPNATIGTYEAEIVYRCVMFS